MEIFKYFARQTHFGPIVQNTINNKCPKYLSPHLGIAITEMIFQSHSREIVIIGSKHSVTYFTLSPCSCFPSGDERPATGTSAVTLGVADVVDATALSIVVMRAPPSTAPAPPSTSFILLRWHVADTNFPTSLLLPDRSYFHITPTSRPLLLPNLTPTSRSLLLPDHSYFQTTPTSQSHSYFQVALTSRSLLLPDHSYFPSSLLLPDRSLFQVK